MNPAAMIKFMGAKKKFEKNHPKFAAFAKKMFESGITSNAWGIRRKYYQGGITFFSLRG